MSRHAEKGDTVANLSRRPHKTDNDLGEFPSSFALSRAPPRQNPQARALSLPGSDEQ
jgi:hypothetical protein